MHNERFGKMITQRQAMQQQDTKKPATGEAQQVYKFRHGL